MAFRLAALRHTRFAVTLLVLCFAAGVRAEEAQEERAILPATTRSDAVAGVVSDRPEGRGRARRQRQQPAVRRAAPSAA